ncbi:uncharacterized protein LOC114362129 [Ostrinia furnacalis]|uniref:uncharacterized protein LOC114362129 n=1 Tax=Ostrinia furnacalis TaxID=93504 RepID=UPI001038864A|nr:uncharacterized protein LOC114362129 [Ostrinia furnacalis]
MENQEVVYNEYGYCSDLSLALAKIAFESPICRSDFVYKWLDDHQPYFCTPLPKVITSICSYSYGPPQIHYYYSQPLTVTHGLRNIKLPYIVQAPFRISPMKPVSSTSSS